MVTWETTTIGELLVFKNGLNKGKEFFGQGTPIVNYMDIYRNRGIHAEQLRGRVTLSAEEIKRFDVQKGDVFFTRTSETPEEVGYTGVMLDNVEDCVFSGFVLRGRPRTNKLDIAYCQYVFMTEEVRKAIMSGCTYTTRALTNGSQLSAIEIRLPHKPEQRLIAEALSDTDALIAALEKLIAKKRAIKQGAMQELLTGKRRLMGFDGERMEKRIGNIGYTYSGLTGKKKEDFGTGNAKYVTFLNVLQNTVIDTTILERVCVDESENQNEVRRGDLFFNTSSETPEEVGMCAVLLRDLNNVYLNSFCFGFRLTDAEMDGLFLSYYFNSCCGRKIMTLLAQGATRYNLSKSYFSDTVIEVPNLSEQSAIVRILSDMDAEIDALTAKLNKLRNIKQGMMSELLTGRIRLVEQEATAEVIVQPKAKPAKVVPVVKATQKGGHSQHFDDAVMIAGIVNAFYSDVYLLGRKKVQKLLYLLRRHQDESTAIFKKKAAGPYADEVRHKGGESVAQGAGYIITTTTKDIGTTFAPGSNIGQALDYIESWGKQSDIQWLTDNFRYSKVDDLELFATVDMAICDLKETGVAVSVASVKHLIATNAEWKAKLKKQMFSDANIARAIQELQMLL